MNKSILLLFLSLTFISATCNQKVRESVESAGDVVDNAEDTVTDLLETLVYFERTKKNDGNFIEDNTGNIVYTEKKVRGTKREKITDEGKEIATVTPENNPEESFEVEKLKIPLMENKVYVRTIGGETGER